MRLRLVWIALFVWAPLAAFGQANQISVVMDSVVQVVIVHSDGKTLSPAGTGFFVEAQGIIATAAHVYWDAGKLICEKRGGAFMVRKSSRTGDKFIVPVNLLIADNTHDVALLKADPARIRSQWPGYEIKPLSLAASEPGIGEDIVLVGHYGADEFPIASRGIVSGYTKLESILPIEEMLLDMVVNRGQSGGPVALAKTGEVVGVCLSTLTVSVTGGPQQSHAGISRAAKVQYVKALLSAPLPH